MVCLFVIDNCAATQCMHTLLSTSLSQYWQQSKRQICSQAVRRLYRSEPRFTLLSDHYKSAIDNSFID